MTTSDENLRTILREFQKENKFTNAVEFRDRVTLAVQGAVPTWLNGILYRIGPGKYNLGSKGGSEHVIQHAFDGLAFVHRVEISGADGKVHYNSRMTAEGAEKRIINKSQQVFFGHLPDDETAMSGATDPAAAGAQQRQAEGDAIEDPSSRNINVTVTPNYPLPSQFGKDDDDPLVLVSKTDSNNLQHVHSVTLEPKRHFNYAAYDKRLDGQLSAAHHKADAKTGETFNFSLHLGPTSKITVFSIKGDKTTVLADITHRKLPGVPEAEQERIDPPYMHAFWLTEHFVVLPESQLHFTGGGADMMKNRTFVGGLRWHEDGPAYLHVVRRDGGGHVVTLAVDDPLFIFHTCNAWDTKLEDGTSVLELDACAWQDGEVIHQVSRFGLMEESTAPPVPKTKIRGLTVPPGPFSFGHLERFHLEFNIQDPMRAKASHRQITPNVEFPRYNPLDDLKPYKYMWGCQYEIPTVSESTERRFSLIKVDVESGAVLKLDQENHVFTEPVFVPRPAATARDDGVLLSFANISGPDGDRSALVVVDAASMVELGRCDLGQFKAVTFHGSFVSGVHFETSSYN